MNTAFLSKGALISLLATSTMLKVIAMTLTPLSPDLTFTVSGLGGGSKWTRTPYGVISDLMYHLWRTLPVDHPNLSLAWSQHAFSGAPTLYLLLALLKLPLLASDLIVGIIVYRTALVLAVRKIATTVSLLWLFNPMSFLLIEMWGSVDIVPTMILLASAYFLIRQRDRLGALAFAASIGLKLYPILALPPFLAVRTRRSSQVLILISAVIGATAYFLWLWNAGYSTWTTLTQYDVFAQYIDEYSIRTATAEAKAFGGVTIGLVTTALIPTYALIFETWRLKPNHLLDATMLPLLVYFAFANWLPQYLIWIIPFMVLQMALRTGDKFHCATILLLGFVVSVMGYSDALTANGNAFFFVPVSGAGALSSAVDSYRALAASNLASLIILQLARGLFTAACVIYALRIVQNTTGVLTRILDVLRVKAY